MEKVRVLFITVAVALCGIAASPLAAADDITAAGNSAAFEVTDATVDPTTVTKGEAAEVTATVENNGNRSGTFTAELTRNGTVTQTSDLSVDAGSTRDVTFAVEPAATGGYDLSVNGVDAGTLTVNDPASFEVVRADLDEGTVEVGETVDATATVENTGETSDTHEVSLQADGTTVETRTIEEIDPGAREEVTFEYVPDEPGEQSIAVDDVTIGTLTVQDPEGDEETEEDDADADDESDVDGDSNDDSNDDSDDDGANDDADDDEADDDEADDAEADDQDGTGTSSEEETTPLNETSGGAAPADNATGTEPVRTEEPTATDTPESGADSSGTLRITDASLSADWVRSGFNTTVRTTVRNPRSRTVDETLTVTVDGEPVATNRVTLDPEEETVVETEFEAVNGTVRVNGVTAGPLTVENQSVSATGVDEEATTAAQGPGFSLAQVGVVVAVLAAIGWTRRGLRHRRDR
ncbi:CARDB domain-containing protein [Haloarcula sp. 1CSR25-25]|uniref:CARDB domain-containing protein n=1 Tax=Haloarcula sp. 1CSR25-25 TaxID=2862545 RepID=UPI0028939409|nr:CARDB domain-containing protein [Haloarcula sp. 1CSR25-25]MDT3435415.1 hypothetical protein [Haloarcula sp. 1CSR25-25]